MRCKALVPICGTPFVMALALISPRDAGDHFLDASVVAASRESENSIGEGSTHHRN